MLELIKTIRSILPGLWAQRWWGLAAACIVGAIGVVAGLLVPDRYSATARLYVDTQSILKPLMSGLAVQPNLDQQVSMMAKTLVSRPNVENLVRMADLDRRTTSPKERDGLVDGLLRDIALKPGQGTNIYQIEYRHGDPDVARKVVQSLMTIFVESNLGGKRRDSEQAQKFIEDQIAIYEKKLAGAEQALKDFKLRNLEVMPNLAQDYVVRANTAQTDLQRARLELRQAESARDALLAQLKGERPDLRGPEPVAVVEAPARASELELKAEAVRQRLAELRVRLTDEHPDVLDTQQYLRSLEDQVEAQRRARRRAPAADGAATATASAAPLPNKLYQDLKLAVADADAKVASLRAAAADAQQRLTEARSIARVVPAVEAEYAQLNRDYEVNKRNYEQLVTRRDAAQISGSMDSTTGVGEIRVIDPPRVSTKPVFPNRMLLLAGAFAASLAAGLGMVVVRAQLRPRFFDIRTLRGITNLPVIGAISMVESPDVRRAERRATLRFAGGVAMYLMAFSAVLAFVAFGQFLA